MIVRASLAVRVAAGLTAAGSAIVIAACGSDDSPENAQIRQFCQSYLSSPAFACCTAPDRAQGQFLVRNHFSSVGQCVNKLTLQSSQSFGRQAFDGAAAQSCLSYLSTRQCGAATNAALRAAEEQAGCGRVLAGKQVEGASCNVQEDCAAGLVCPPTKDTGLSACSKPGENNQSCNGEQARSIDHPACIPGQLCTFQGELPACPSPPCLDFKCVPRSDEGETCTELDCAEGLACVAGVCAKGGPSAAGGPCQVLDHCQDGLYCEPTTGTCAARKSAGAPCVVANNPLLECAGICADGLCAAFCGSQ